MHRRGLQINSPVIIKSSSQGMVIRMNPEIPYEELKESIRDKFTQSADFFKDAKVKLAFEGRELTKEQEEEILEIIDDCTQLRVLCIVDLESLNEDAKEITKEKKETEDMIANIGQFFRGTLRSGQILETETSIVIIGDVEQGANIISKGNVVVLGKLRGSVYAGAGNNHSAFVAALFMEPSQIKIGEYRRKSRTSRTAQIMRPKVAYVEDGRVCFDTIS